MAYTDKEGENWQRIISYRALSRSMHEKYGTNWKEEVRYTYGDEQLGL